jgi:endonuclease G
MLSPLKNKAMESMRERFQRTFTEQKASLEKINQGRPLDAEDDHVRKMSFIRKQIGVPEEIADAIGHYRPAETLPLPEEKKKKAEALQGATIDFMNVSFLNLGLAASRAIGRISFSDGQPLGTGFLVSPKLLLTNNHVISNPEETRSLIVEFQYERDYAKSILPTTIFSFDPQSFFVTNDEDDLDFTLIALGKKITGPLNLEDIGYLPMISASDKHVKGMFINCIQHPEGNFKQLVVRENHLLARTDNTLIYSSDTLPGASGSPLFNDDWEVVGLHHWGEPYKALVDNPQGMPKNGNEGIRISAIIDFLDDLTFSSKVQSYLLHEALNHGFREPSFIRTPVKPERLRSIEVAANSRSGIRKELSYNNANPTGNGQMNSDGSIQLNIPIKVSYFLESAQNKTNGLFPSSNGFTQELVAGSEAFKFVPDENYKTRKGYNENFLGITVPLPKLSQLLSDKAAVNKNAKPTDNPIEFKYQHFSVVMNAERKIAFYTAVNIDGGSVVKINRTKGTVSRGPEGAESREKWYDDPRIDESEVSNDDMYKRSEMKDFHRGHLVKRTDPSWGTVDKAFKGQADTFHFLNCAPQHKLFNPNKSKWAGVEDWITNNSDDDNIRITVFSGPIFENDDPVYFENFRVPKAFWKVLAWSQDGELLATGIISDQSDLLEDSSESLGREVFDTLPDKLPQEYHVAIEEIEEKTGIRFGDLKEVDTFSGGEGIIRAKKLENFQQLLPSKIIRKVTF